MFVFFSVGMEYNNGKCLCPGPVQPLANFTCPPYQQTCSSDHFTCRNGLCVPRGWKCDGEDDCGDSSDETQCGTQTCPPNYFICDTTKCLPQYWRCDYDNDCVDGADEMNCPRQNCTDGQFTCRNGRCIAAKVEVRRRERLQGRFGRDELRTGGTAHLQR
jgi:hypothetical protein